MSRRDVVEHIYAETYLVDPVIQDARAGVLEGAAYGRRDRRVGKAEHATAAAGATGVVLLQLS